MTENERALTEGLKKARDIAMNHIRELLKVKCDKIVLDALSRREGWSNFTGNTITGYACGLYENGELISVSMSSDRMKPAVRVKLKKGERAKLNPDYDGKARSLKGTVDTDGGYGADFALSFLSSYKATSSGFDIVMCTGTEYSSYIETVRHGNILTDTFSNITNILFTGLTKI